MEDGLEKYIREQLALRYEPSEERGQNAVLLNEPQQHPVALSLFSGAGGLDIGFHRAGFRIAACVELERAFSLTLAANLGTELDRECQVLNRDIRDLSPDEIQCKDFDFIIGGPPCQSFSAIGRRAGGVNGIQDQRGSLFEHYCWLVQHYQPQGFLFENVRGILSANGGQDWARIVRAFADLGYFLSYRVLDCAGYGVPQHRERLIMLGSRLPNVRFPRPTHGPDSVGKNEYVSAYEAVKDLQDPEEPLHKSGGKYGAYLEEVPPGQNYHYFTQEMGHPQPAFAWRSRFSDFLYKADPDKPVRTIVASLGAYSGPFHWKNRKMTLAEFKRLQTFPDAYQILGGYNVAQKQIGNSVPPLFAQRLAEAILEQIFHVPLGVDFLPKEEKLGFDARKAGKAKATRNKRTQAVAQRRSEASLFGEEKFADEKDAPIVPPIGHCAELYWNYLTPQRRRPLEKGDGPVSGNVYKVTARRQGAICDIEVSRLAAGVFSHSKMLKYSVCFHHPIGNGLEQIQCVLCSDAAEDIPVAWDAIEDCLGNSSAYRTMMDVYGHFTEPHPIFDLRMELLTNNPPFLLRFAKHFSEFHTTRRVLPAAELKNIYGDDLCDFDLSDVAQQLRRLRFDVRVNQTNKTIPPDHFRCCYPFTIHIDKQVSVNWKEQ